MFSFRERHTERETGEENKISGEHDNISENLRIINYLYIVLHANVSYDRAVFETEDASLIYRGYPRNSA